MILYRKPDGGFEQRIASRSIDVLILAGLILATAALCFNVFAPFLPLMVWALIVAGSPYPPRQSVTGKLGGRQRLSATRLVRSLASRRSLRRRPC